MEQQTEFTMEKVFAPNQVEKRIYDMWENSGAFKPVIDPSKKPFTIVMPPPNITGQLHVGHALDELPQETVRGALPCWYIREYPEEGQKSNR